MKFLEKHIYWFKDPQGKSTSDQIFYELPAPWSDLSISLCI